MQMKGDAFPHRPIIGDKHSEAIQIKVKKDLLLKTVLAFAIPLVGAALLWWLSKTFVPLERYERERAEDKGMQREMRDDIKSILREVKK